MPDAALCPTALGLKCPLHISRWLLGSIVVLGLVHGVAFSASYQMVSRFANKNTISLGLGCVGSGLLVLFIEVAMQLGPKPSRTASIILFETVAGGQSQTADVRAVAAAPVPLRLEWQLMHVLVQGDLRWAVLQQPMCRPAQEASCKVKMGSAAFC